MSDAKTRRKALYIAEARVTGGRAQGHGATSDGALEVALRCRTEMGDEGGGTNPEQLFAVGYAACMRSALGIVARRQGVDLDDIEIDSEVMVLPTDEGGFQYAVQLHVTLPSIEQADRAVELVRTADLLCPFSNATRGNIDLELTANGAPVEEGSRPTAEIAVTVTATGEAYVALVVGPAPDVRDSVPLDALEAADAIPALEGLVLDFDHFRRLVGLRITGAADSILAPSLLETAERGEP